MMKKSRTILELFKLIFFCRHESKLRGIWRAANDTATTATTATTDTATDATTTAIASATAATATRHFEPTTKYDVF